jgi:predicted alpha/beta hydrolase
MTAVAGTPNEARTEDGVRLLLRRFAPRRGSGSGVVLLTHAMMVDGRTLLRLAGHLAAAGLEAWILDFRGHGRSTPPTARRADWTFEAYVERDLPAALDAVARASGCAAGAIDHVGHSLGGLVGLGAGAPFRRQVLLTTCWWRFRSRTSSLQRQLTMASYAAVARLVGYAPIRLLRLGTDDEPRGYVLQLAGWAFGRRWCSPSGLDYEGRLRAVGTPTLSLVGAGDWLCTRADAGETIAPLSGPHGVEEVGRASGLPFDPSHFELVRDRRAAPVWERIARFLCSPKVCFERPDGTLEA